MCCFFWLKDLKRKQLLKSSKSSEPGVYDTPLIPALVRLKQAGLEFKESLAFLVKTFLNESDGVCVFV